MISFNSKEINYWKENIIIIKNLDINEDLVFFLLIDSKDKIFAELFLNKSLDFITWTLSNNNIYKDFTNIIESLNSFIRNWFKDKQDLHKKTSIIIWVNYKNRLYFSNIWKSSAYLVKSTNEKSEITQKDDIDNEFTFISEWILENNDILIFSWTRLLDYLSYSDFNNKSGWQNLENINNKIQEILDDEKIATNVWLLSMKYNEENIKKLPPNNTKEKVYSSFLKLLDNKITKLSFAYFLFIKDNLIKNKKNKNILFTIWIIISFFILFNIISWVFNNKNIDWTKNNKTPNIEDISSYIKTANNSKNNPELFNEYLEKAEENIKILEEKKLFLNQIKKLKEEISLSKQVFKQIQWFNESDERLVYTLNNSSNIKIIEINYKIYVISKNWVLWPILEKNKASNFVCDILEKNDYFIDAIEYNNNILLLTKSSKVVEFKTNWIFSFKDVQNQNFWWNNKKIDKYNSNIYLLDKDKDQILKHTTNNWWKTFNKAEEYLKKEDETSWLNIVDIAIDWDIIILKNNMSLLKRVSNKKNASYVLEKYQIKKLLDETGFKIENNNQNISLKTTASLKSPNKYLYILLNDKIWIFKTISWIYSLTYLWQIEWANYKIIDFHIVKDWELYILNEKWVFKLSFEVSDDKLKIIN